MDQQLVLDAIAQAAERIVNSEGFVERLADAVTKRLNATRNEYAVAVPHSTQARDLVLGDPQRTASGKLVILTQLPIQGRSNIHLVVMAKDTSKVDQPRRQGHELDNYQLFMYHDEIIGDLRSRTVFRFDPEKEMELEVELRRQLARLPNLRHFAFFYLNVLTLNQEALA